MIDTAIYARLDAWGNYFYFVDFAFLIKTFCIMPNIASSLCALQLIICLKVQTGFNKKSKMACSSQKLLLVVDENKLAQSLRFSVML